MAKLKGKSKQALYCNIWLCKMLKEEEKSVRRIVRRCKHYALFCSSTQVYVSPPLSTHLIRLRYNAIELQSKSFSFFSSRISLCVQYIFPRLLYCLMHFILSRMFAFSFEADIFKKAFPAIENNTKSVAHNVK